MLDDTYMEERRYAFAMVGEQWTKAGIDPDFGRGFFMGQAY